MKMVFEMDKGKIAKGTTIRKTRSVCPVCFDVIPARIFEHNGAVYIEKECPTHGYFSDICWSDAELYRRFECLDVARDDLHQSSYQSSHKSSHEEYVNQNEWSGCPYKCGLCPAHASPTVLGVIDVTGRCNLRCPVCFADSDGAVSGAVSKSGSNAIGGSREPSLGDIANMTDALVESGAVAIQFSGGEPTLRDDLPEMIAYARKKVKHVQVDTNGIRMAESEDFCKEMESAGLSVVYLQFDGVTEAPYIKMRGRKMLDVKLKAIENHRNAGENPAIVLVPTVARGVNDAQIGDIIKFALENIDIVRGVNFQPIAFCGRTGCERQMRITVSDVIKAAVNQTGFMRCEDFFPPSAMGITLNALGASRVGCHHACGAFTYLVVREREGEKTAEPLTDYVNMRELLNAMKGGKMSMHAILRNIRPKFVRLFSDALRSYFKLSELHRKLLFVGAMHFMDAFNFDVERARRCCIHYALPSGEIIPFCSYNVVHRSRLAVA